MKEIFVRKLKTGKWEAYDREGNRVEAVTKEMAINQHKILYRDDELTSYNPIVNLSDLKL